MAFAVPAVVLIVSVAKIFSDPPIRGNLPKADLAILEDEDSALGVEPPFSSASSIIPEIQFTIFWSANAFSKHFFVKLQPDVIIE